jgi:2-oxoglutarate dehydrogenase E1 component
LRSARGFVTFIRRRPPPFRTRLALAAAAAGVWPLPMKEAARLLSAPPAPAAVRAAPASAGPAASAAAPASAPPATASPAV